MSSINFKVVDGKQVEKILEQGQKLRNAMLTTILKNDPFTAEVVPQKHYNTPIGSQNDFLNTQSLENSTGIKINSEKQQLIEAYLKGDYLTKDQERSALVTLKSMSGVELSDLTQQTLSSRENTFRKQANFKEPLVENFKENHLPKPCFCRTCKVYLGANLDCDLRRPHSQTNLHQNLYTKNYDWQNGQILKYADSLKIFIHNISLNDIGNKKTVSCGSKQQTIETYFIEYHLPSYLIGNLAKSKSKVNSGLDNSSVRICSRKSGESINFNQTFTHDIANLHESNLHGTEIIFKISHRGPKQKFSEIFGFAKLKFDSFLASTTLSCSKALAIHFRSEDCPIIVGTLKVTAHLGCGRLYFGKDFIEAINCEQNSETLQSESSNSENENTNYANYANYVKKKEIVENRQTLPIKTVEGVQARAVKETNQVFKRHASAKYSNSKASAYFVGSNKENTDHVKIKDSPQETSQKQLLFGFIYISEAQFLNQCPSSYISCQPFCQNETSNSRLVANASNPLYNFCQKVPLLYDDDFLFRLRENLTVVEFWERQDQTDSLFGVTKLPLHQFYLAYRNSVILQHLTKNKLPIIGTDWWEPIYSIENEELIGQVQVLTALGTAQQIENLECERGFKNDLVNAKYLKPVISKFNIGSLDGTHWRDRVKVNRKSEALIDKGKSLNSVNELPTKLFKNPISLAVDPLKRSKVSVSAEKKDIGVQSDLNLNMDMNSRDDTKSHPSESQDMITSFLKILEQQRQPRTVVMETATNTDNDPTASTENKDIANSNVRKTSDLLDVLQKALSIDSRLPPVAKVKSNVFKAHISIKSANHLPSKKKIKAKKSKNRGRSQEESIFPSTYVTFETVPDESLKITSVVPKSTSPQWNYECDVELPTNLLTNSEKRLLFKVWKKSNNVVLQPNMQTDTVLGLATVDLTVLVAGLPNVQGWYNIVDFSGSCNGQINIHVTPLDNLNRFRQKPKPQPTSDKVSDQDEGNDLLGRALKRKFTELDEITQRLRLRLSEVVDNESENDEMADEFERDIDSLCIEEDFDMVNFEKEAKRLNLNIAKSKSDFNDLLSIQSNPGSSKEPSSVKLVNPEVAAASSNLLSAQEDKNPPNEIFAPSLIQFDNSQLKSYSSASLPTDRHLLEGKQRIDTLLEKLSLISSETAQAFSNRYVSGCSVSNQYLDIDTEFILKGLDRDSRPNITDSNLNRFKEMYGETLASQSKISTDQSDVNLLKSSGSDSSVVTNFSDCRPNPDGQGNVSDDKSSS